MPFRIIRNDITKVRADAIVNTANPEPAYGSGTDGAIYRAAGEEKLLAERRKIGRIKTGEAAVTPAFALPAKYIIHTVGPAWLDGNHGEFEELASCYRKSLLIARQLGCGSIAFPLISTGVYGFPKDKALSIALEMIADFLEEAEMDVTLVVFDKRAFDLSASLAADVRQFIDENYVSARREEEYGAGGPQSTAFRRRERYPEHIRNEGPQPDLSSFPLYEASLTEDACQAPAPAQAAPKAQAAPEAAEAQAAPRAAEAVKKAKARKLPKFLGSKKTEKAAGTEKAVETEKAAGPEKARKSARRRSLTDVMRHIGESYQERLLRLIDEKGLTDAQVYKRANVDRRLFSKIRCNADYMPGKRTALALAVALELNLDETIDLLSRAGIALSPSSKFDLIVEYCIDNRIYNIYEINALLFEYDQPMLGSSMAD